MSIAALLNDENSNESDLNPAQRCRQVFIELAAYIRSNIDPNAMFISWKNDEGFSTMHMDAADKFPKELVKIATFFEGYKANLKESSKIYFKFCLHTPGQFEKRVKDKLKEWRELHGFTLYKCTIQAESSRVIGWLVYSMGFTNEKALLKVLNAKASHEWGFISNAISSTDSKVEWKNRLKALNVLVPSKNEESAREVVANTFSQKSSEKNTEN